MKMRSTTHFLALAVICCLTLASPTGAWQAPQPASPTDTAAADTDKPLLKAEELEQLIAPIALYPDALLTQILMASTYPLEVVTADRWVKAHKDLKGDALTAELEMQDWDPSIKSLVNFPDVLAMMSEELDTTIKLGDAFLAQQADVLASVQVLRAKAQKEGNLQSNQQQVVKVEAAPPPTEQTQSVVVQQQPPQIITIESSNPEVIYVPSYNPAVVYGTWPYPSYPPYPYYPPGYVASNVISFGVGVACGAAWGYAWGHCDWGHGDCDIDIDRNTNINTNINREKYKQEFDQRRSERDTARTGDRTAGDRTGQQSGRGSWQHDPSHRKGVSYRDSQAAQRFGASDARTSQAREQFRGRAETGRQDLSRGAADQFRGTGARDTGVADHSQSRAGGQASHRVGQEPAGRDRASGSTRAPSTYDRAASSGDRSSAFNHGNRSGSQARAASQRGQSSRSSYSSSSRSGGSRSSYSGGSRSYGGGSRGGGSRGGGRR